MATQPDLNLGKHVDRSRDIFLCHNGANKSWVEALAEQLETVRHNNRYPQFNGMGYGPAVQKTLDHLAQGRVHAGHWPAMGLSKAAREVNQLNSR
jgi:hypothetical protein